MESSIEVRLSNGRNLMVPLEFDVSHLRALLEVMVVSSRKPLTPNSAAITSTMGIRRTTAASGSSIGGSGVSGENG
jgi:hypothetical protein